MIARTLDLLAIWRNPVFVRYRRSRLRLRRAIFWYLLTLVITTFVVALAYTLMTNSGKAPQDAARDLWIPLLIIQGLILMIKGTGAVSAGLIQDKIDGTLDYQRLTPLSPMRSLLGYVYGLPVLEYAMFALTLPHLAFVAIVGNIPAGTLVSVYFAFFVCVTLYHLTGIAIGLMMKRWIVGYLLSVFTVVTVNVFLPTVVSQLGLKFVQFLSVWPVIGQKILPLTVPPAALELARNNPWYSLSGDVPIYGFELSVYSFTLLMQGALIVTFALIALRRWRSTRMHALSKPYALAFLSAFVVVLIGNVWPAITGQYLPFAIFGVTDIAAMGTVIPVAFPIVYGLVAWLLCLVLFAIVVPDHHAFVRGIRRAAKRGRDAPYPWSDDADGPGFMLLFVVVVLAGFGVVYRELTIAGMFDFVADQGPGLWRLPAALALVLVYTHLLIQVCELKPTSLVILIVWFVPVLASIVLSALTQTVDTPHAVIASVSPLALLLMSGAVPLVDAAPFGSGNEFRILLTGVATGLGFTGLQVGVLAVRWRQRRRDLRQRA